MRNKAVKLASQIVAKTRLARGLDRFNARRGGVILAFHEITEPQLAMQLAQVAEMYTFVSLAEFTARLAGGKSTARLAAITFDDGYGPVVEAAARLAARHGWPMTFYLPTRYLDTGEPFWYQELRPLLELAARARKEVRIDDLSFALTDRASVAEAQKILDQRFRRQLSFAEVEGLLRRTRRALLGDERRPADLPTTAPISWERARELARRDELSFESHTVNHLALSRLGEDAARDEMERSRTRIEEATNRAVHHFCYPYGGLPEIGTIVPRLARTLFRSATTMLRGRCHRGADPAMLPRIPLYQGDAEQVVALKVGLAR